MKDNRIEKLARLLVEYSVCIKDGEKVFVMCDETATPWMVEVVKAVLKCGAHVETLITSQEVSEVKFRYGSKKQLKTGSFVMEKIAETSDVILTAWGGRNTRINAGIDTDKIKWKACGDSGWRAIFSKRMGDGSLRWCGTQFPTHSDAQEANMSLSDYEEFVYGAGLLNEHDPVSEWKKISRKQEKWVRYLNSKNEIRIISKQTDIKADVSGRKWINCDGKENFPDGEIFTSPVEESVNGHISFSFPGIYAGQEIEGIYLEVKDGIVVKATADKGETLLNSLLDTDEGAKKIGELAIGTNYNINRFTKNMLFDEKIGGTVHMAIGDSIPESGGQNRSSIHWDMLCDMRQEGEIYADGELFYQHGRFFDTLVKDL